MSQLLLEMTQGVETYSNAEIIDLMASSIEVIVTQIASVEELVRRSVNFTFDLKNVQKLMIIAKLHTKTLAAIEQQKQTETSDFTREDPQNGNEAEVVAWQRLSSTLADARALRTLRVWLDRSDHHYWSTIDEISDTAPLALLSKIPRLDVLLKLSRHYNDDTTILPFPVRRRLRQRYFGYTDSLGTVHIIHKADFPMLEASDFPIDWWSAADAEDAERDPWREGVDIQHIFIDGGRWLHRSTM